VFDRDAVVALGFVGLELCLVHFFWVCFTGVFILTTKDTKKIVFFVGCQLRAGQAQDLPVQLPCSKVGAVGLAVSFMGFLVVLGFFCSCRSGVGGFFVRLRLGGWRSWVLWCVGSCGSGSVLGRGGSLCRCR